jgi:serine/threonine protein phosphatase 1
MAKAEYIWAIGDIHGYSTTLTALLNRINEFNTKKIIFLGDYIDRGPEPKEVIDIILDQKTEKVTLMGNHELMFLNCTENEKSSTKALFEWSQNGYETTLRSFNVGDVASLGKDIDPKYIDFIKSLGIYHVETIGTDKKNIKLLFCHAGPFLEIPMEEQLTIKNYIDYNNFLESKKIPLNKSSLWNNDALLQKNVTSWGNYLLVHGHMRTQYRQGGNKLQISSQNDDSNDMSDIPNPLYLPGDKVVASLGIDTGVDIGGKLTAVGFSKSNTDFSNGKMLIKVIQVDSTKKSKNAQIVEFSLSIPFTEDVSLFNKILKKVFKSDAKKKAPKSAHGHGHGHAHKKPAHGAAKKAH